MSQNTTQILSLVSGDKAVQVDLVQVKKAAAILRSVNHKLRQQMLQMLNDSARMTVTEMYVKLRIEQSVASQHLAILRRSGVVITKREGKFIFYSVNYEKLAEVTKFVGDLAG